MTASANRDRFRSIAYRYRNLPAKYGLRPYTVAVVITSHSGTYPGDGTETNVSTAIVESGGYAPKVRELNDEELALSGLGRETWEIGPITPDFSAGGISIATLLANSADSGDQIHYVLTGPKYPDGVRCERIGVSSDRALHYKIRVSPISTRSTS